MLLHDVKNDTGVSSLVIYIKYLKGLMNVCYLDSWLLSVSNFLVLFM